MAKPLPTTSYTGDSSNFVVGAGAVVYGFEYDKTAGAYTYEGTFGATSGGSTVSLTTTLYQLEIDGLLTAPVGADMIEEAEGTMELNLMEATYDNLRRALIAEERTASNVKYLKDGTKYIRPVGRIQEQHYIEGLALITPLSDGSMLVVRFDYAIATEGLEFNPQQQETNVFTVTLGARTSTENLIDASLPVSIFKVDKEHSAPNI